MAKPTDQTLWGIHAGATGDAHRLFTERHCIALGWDAFGDLSKLLPNRDAFKAAYDRAYPGQKPMTVAVSAGQLFRFIHEMRPGDLVLYPSKVDRQIHVGRVTGPIDGDALVGLILAHYEAFDSRYKGALPLKRVYVLEQVLGGEA